MLTVTKAFQFDAAHKLNDYVGPCANVHGHTYQGTVTIEGPVSEVGMIIDFKDLKEILKKTMIAKFDHKYINDMVNYNPTAENMVMDIVVMLNNTLPQGVKLVGVKLWETPDSYAEWTKNE